MWGVLGCFSLACMKTYLLGLAFLLTFTIGFAQTNTFPSSGNVGIGTTTPAANLSFKDLTATSDPTGISWYAAGPTAYGIHRTAGGWDAPNYQQLRLSWSTGITIYPGYEYVKSFVDIQGGGLRVTSGSVGIGTTDTQGYKLAVAGNMIAESIKVKLQGAWPDYVFTKEYQLPTLEQTERYIKENGHLQGIPSASEVKASGIDLGGMNAKLLKKIEELTLHLIEKNKTALQQQDQINLLQKQVALILSKVNP